jgi:ABC-2 type transport system permease protein
MRRLWAILLRDVQTELTYPLAFALQFVGILFSVFMFYFLSQFLGGAIADRVEIGQGGYFPFVLLGVAFTGYFSVGLNRFADALSTAQVTGTMEALLMTPSRLSVVVVGSVMYDYVYTTLRVILFLAMGVVLGVRFPDANWTAAGASLVLAITAFASIGIMAAGFTMVFKRGNPIIWLVSNLVSLLGGVYYPVASLPAWLQLISRALPITYALDAMRGALLDGATWGELAPDMLVLAGFCLVLFPLSLVTFRAAVHKARVDGSLTQY